ncbi:MAG: 3-oxoacyl-ACP reductase FabG [Deltaproteobacteria bacterium]|jgi:NAD(P)-dependent dehydrogenase (short-subunit alcohol dehydrogenase family)|nr:3-oxoacyl-ACP reductase FabG [Deltaproteobacteria bacterium]MBW2499325.1 3-oxoacyl-ACP reductase FabG [Deltaproteobacteria bacterium]
MGNELAGKRAVVTGASRGLGRAFARALAAEGAQVVINATNAVALEETVKLIAASGGTCESVVGSVADESVAEALVERCVSSFGGIDALVNNAGINRDRTLMRMTAEEFDDVIAVNLRGTWACSKHAALAMKETGGCIVNVTSNSGLTGSVGQTNYAGAKAGVVGMTFTWAQELSRYGIRCNAIWPLALTQMTEPVYARRKQQAEESGDPVPAPEDAGFGDPDDVARLVAFLVSDAASEINGQLISFNGRKLALWSHPREINIERRDGWTLDDLMRDFRSTAGRALEEMYRASPT